MDDILGGLTALIVFIGMSMPFIVVGLVYYLKKKLYHKEVIAAIEKGMPISELNLRKAKAAEDDQTAGPGWVRDITKGITCLIIAAGIGFVFYYWLIMCCGPKEAAILWIVPVIFLAKGIGLIMRGNMRKKYEKQPEEQANGNTSSELPLPVEE